MSSPRTPRTIELIPACLLRASHCGPRAWTTDACCNAIIAATHPVRDSGGSGQTDSSGPRATADVGLDGLSGSEPIALPEGIHGVDPNSDDGLQRRAEAIRSIRMIRPIRS